MVALGILAMGLCYLFLKACEKIRETTMIYLAAAVALFLLIYLFVAMIRPENSEPGRIRPRTSYRSAHHVPQHWFLPVALLATTTFIAFL